MSNATNFIRKKVIEIKPYSNKLISFCIERPTEYNFRAGQFSRLGFEDGQGFIWRAYSIMSAEYDNYLKYFAVLIADGKMSSRLKELKLNDLILLDKTSGGFLLPYRFETGTSLLMLATGSGVAPFISQLQNEDIWMNFKNIYLVHCVSYFNDLISPELIDNLSNNLLIGKYIKSDQFKFIGVVTRQKIDNFLNKRIPKLISDGDFSKIINNFTTLNAKIMICGNPEMVQESFKELLKLGFTMHRNNAPGNIIMENGF